MKKQAKENSVKMTKKTSGRDTRPGPEEYTHRRED